MDEMVGVVKTPRKPTAARILAAQTDGGPRIGRFATEPLG